MKPHGRGVFMRSLSSWCRRGTDLAGLLTLLMTLSKVFLKDSLIPCPPTAASQQQTLLAVTHSTCGTQQPALCSRLGWGATKTPARTDSGRHGAQVPTARAESSLRATRVSLTGEGSERSGQRTLPPTDPGSQELPFRRSLSEAATVLRSLNPTVTASFLTPGHSTPL